MSDQTAAINILNMPSEILYEILVDPLAEFFHGWLMQTNQTTYWDALLVLTQLNRFVSDVVYKIIKHALGTYRLRDGTWKLRPRRILADMRRYGELLRTSTQDAISDEAMQSLLAIPKTPLLYAYVGAIASADSLARMQSKARTFELRAWGGAYPPIAMMAKKPVEAAKSVKQHSLRRRILCAALENYEQTLMLKILLDGWKAVNVVLLKHDSRCQKSTPVNKREIEEEVFETDLADALGILKAYDRMFVRRYANLVDKIRPDELGQLAPEEHSRRMEHARDVASETIKMLHNLIRDLRDIWTMSFQEDSEIPDIVECLLWKLDPDHPADSERRESRSQDLGDLST